MQRYDEVLQQVRGEYTDLRNGKTPMTAMAPEERQDEQPVLLNPKERFEEEPVQKSKSLFRKSIPAAARSLQVEPRKLEIEDEEEEIAPDWKLRAPPVQQQDANAQDAERLQKLVGMAQKDHDDDDPTPDAEN